MWKNQWRKDTGEISGAETVFLDFFEVVYNETKEKSKQNRQKNFMVKNTFIGCLFLLAVSLVVIPYYAIARKSLISINDLTFLNAQILLVGGTFLFAIHKIISVKKYQETWSRHSRTLYKYQLTMMYYLLGSLPAQISQPANECPSDQSDRSNKLKLRKIFIDQILQIADGNLQKFSHNMEENEKDLMEGVREFFTKL
ncbi:MAG: hypothetical protein HFF90_07710 [Oscillibacter sp.]|nr:hypothetical protein [Oscillibacter sp.]